MAKLWEFFENMDEIVYVSDMDTHEMIYMNKKALKTYGYFSNEELQGKKCYEILQGLSIPCSMCQKGTVTQGEFKEWRLYNPILKKKLELKDTLLVEDGRNCWLEIAVDMSERERQSSMLRGYRNLEALANKGMRLALKADTPDKEIEVLLAYLGKALKGERTYIFERNAKGNDDNTYEWVAEGITSEKDNLQDLPAEVCANWYNNFSENKTIIIKDLEDTKESDPLQYENLKAQDIHSIVVVPLYDDQRAIGFYGVDNPPVDFLDETSDILQIVAHFIISSLKRRELLKQLTQMSYYDRMTGFGNRYAVDDYVAKLSEKKSLGVIYCDITGLKKINDNLGHEAGDRLILRACQCLRKLFGEYGLFRIGGDELLVLCGGIGKEDLEKQVELLKRELPKYEVTMAVGMIWQREGIILLDKLLNEAEKLMYEDKADYYKNAGIDRR